MKDVIDANKIRYLEVVASCHFPGDSYVINEKAGLHYDLSTTRRYLNELEKDGLVTSEVIRVVHTRYKKWSITDKGMRMLHGEHHETTDPASHENV